jgi:hypothetical protein
MMIVLSLGLSVVAFKQSGILERRGVTADLMLYMMIKNYGMLYHADGADCKRAGPFGRPCARRSNCVSCIPRS